MSDIESDVESNIRNFLSEFRKIERKSSLKVEQIIELRKKCRSLHHEAFKRFKSDTWRVWFLTTLRNFRTDEEFLIIFVKRCENNPWIREFELNNRILHRRLSLGWIKQRLLHFELEVDKWHNFGSKLRCVLKAIDQL